MTSEAPRPARLVLVTAPDLEVAERLVTALVEERVAACGNIVPGLVSIYRWHGAVERAAETLIVLKTMDATVPALLQRVGTLHPYEVPEMLVVPVEGGHAPYLDWLAENVDQS
ncbi:MAG TPA: divalent-cation tolerance protein CutA [Longimicrobiales bacterium]|nr:divalent-cation tolerance protein CutA [Longimicrobiales bacterium]